MAEARAPTHPTFKHGSETCIDLIRKVNMFGLVLEHYIRPYYSTTLANMVNHNWLGVNALRDVRYSTHLFKEFSFDNFKTILFWIGLPKGSRKDSSKSLEYFSRIPIKELVAIAAYLDSTHMVYYLEIYAKERGLEAFSCPTTGENLASSLRHALKCGGL